MKGLKFPAELPESVTDALARLDGERLERLYDFLKDNEERIRQMSRNQTENRQRAIRKQEENIRAAREDNHDLHAHDACYYDGSDKAIDYIVEWSCGVAFTVSAGRVGCRKVMFRHDPSSPVCPDVLKWGSYLVCKDDFTFCQMTAREFADYREGKNLDVWRP